MFKLKKNCLYRQGRLFTKSSSLNTPIFLPDATRGFLKLTNYQDLINLKMQAIVVNTFHLYLQPGQKIIKNFKGLHQFINWSNAIVSDSGGFQVFSLVYKNKKMGEINDEHVKFKSPSDGSWHILSPEKSINIQFDLNSDIIVCLDDCPPYDCSNSHLKKSVLRTINWAKRSKEEYLSQLKKRKVSQDKRPLLMAVIQGGLDISLRKYCADELIKIGFDAYGFGARPVDKKGVFLDKILKETASFIPQDKLRFALGVGMPEDIYRCYLMGWDAFDCVIPSREGRHGRLFFFNKNFQKLDKKMNFYYTVNIKNSKFKNDKNIINMKSQFKGLNTNNLAYLHHLFKSNEPLGQYLASLNNLEFYQKLIKELKKL